jgi:hypothetical protein
MIATPTRDRWGRSIAKMEADLHAAHAGLDEAAALTTRAYDAWQDTRTDNAEQKAMAAWEKALEAQNRAAGRLHDANRALDRPACDDRR